MSKHYSDELLVSFADGEASQCERAAIRLHLHACWQCRLRLKNLEEAALRFTEAFENAGRGDPFRMIDARLRFDERVRAYQRTAAVPKKGGIWRSWRMGLALAGCVAALAVLLVWRPGSGRAVLQRIETAEMSSAGPVVRQALDLEIEVLRPKKEESRRRLEIASEPARNRFECRLTDSSGTLHYAVWRSGPGEEYRYDRVRGAQPAVFTHNTERDDLPGRLWGRDVSVGGIEQALIQWLEERAWKPLSLAHALSLFAAEDGSVLSARRMGESGKLRLTVTKTRGDSRIEAVLEADPATYRPQLQRIRVSGPTREFEVRFRPVPGAVLREAAFRPEAALFSTRTSPSAAPPAPKPVPPHPAARPEPVADHDLAFEGEVAVLYALHTVGACRGEPIEVTRDPQGKVLVRGLVRDEERRQEVLASLGQWAGEAWLVVELRTTADAFSEMAAGASAATTARSAASRPVMLAELERYYQGRSDAPAREARIFQDDAMRLMGALLTETQALRAAAARLNSPPAHGLSRTAERLLLRILNAHAYAANAQARALLAHWTPVLGPGPQRPPEPTRTADATTLSRSAYEMQHLLFQEGSRSRAGEQRAGRFLTNLSQIQSQSGELAARLTARLKMEEQ